MKYLKRVPLLLLGMNLFIILVVSSCQDKSIVVNYEKGSFGYDLAFLQKKDNVIVLSDGDAQVIVSPNYQGKVFTSTANGLSGVSFGWINHEAIAADTVQAHINVYGGEDRLWLGPEGGQFSIFFKENDKMELANWQTPAFQDTDSWDLISNDAKQVTMKKNFQVTNYSNTQFEGRLDRKVILRTAADLEHDLAIKLSDAMSCVAYQSENTLTNTGDEAWAEESGTLCIWVLGMFNASDSANILIPYKEEVEGEQLGPEATTDYFGTIPSDRIHIDNGLITLKADCNFRSKIGVSPYRSTPLAGSYDPINKALTIVKYNKPTVSQLYINQLWEIQDEPFAGDVINAYNDGPVAGGGQLGAFYEIETSSPAAFLAPEESITHISSTYHIVGEQNELARIAFQLLGANLSEL